MKIAFVGNFVEKKGSQEFAQALIKSKNKYEVYIFGNLRDQESFEKINYLVKKSCLYTTDQLSSLLKKHEIDLVIIPSIWPETFSRTFFSCFCFGIPVATSYFSCAYHILGKEYPLFFNSLNSFLIKSEKELTDQIKKFHIYKKTKLYDKIVSEIRESQEKKYTIISQIIEN